MNSRLASHEWISVITIIAFMVLFSAIAFFDDEPVGVPVSMHEDVLQPFIHASISGAVASPGHYQFPADATVGDLLILAQPLPSADLRRINRQAKLREGRSLVIQELPTNTLYVQGAVIEPGPVIVPKGTTLDQLLQKITLAPDADIDKLKSSKKLRDRQIIDIPFKKTEPLGGATQGS